MTRNPVPMPVPEDDNLPEAVGRGDTRIGLIDIGSSSIRLVIYRAGGRLPHPQFNEREVCRLGAGVGETGSLDSARIDHALDTLGRYAIIARRSGLDRLDVFATEAVRRADNRSDFLGPAEEILGCPIRLLSGAEEARYAALGVVSGFVEADGVVADLGGGSLELQAVGNGVLLDMPPEETSRPLGYLNQLSTEEVAASLASLSWAGKHRGCNLYAVGGTWRAIATAYSAQSRKHLDIVHGLTLKMPKLGRMMDAIDAVDGEIEGIPPARRPTMRQGLLVLRALIGTLEPSRVVFSSYGAREGILYEKLDAAQARVDPLIAGAREYAGMWQRHDGQGEALERAMEGFAAVLPEPMRRLARASALLADLAWLDFPDYRGALSVEKMLGLSVVGITHSERIWMAAALHVRYHGRLPRHKAIKGGLKRDEKRSACYAGLVLRMLMNLTGGLPELIDGLRVEQSKKALSLVLGPELSGLRSELFQRRVEAVAEYSPLPIVIR